MDPTLISAGIGLMGSLFGSRPSVPQNVQENYNLINSILRRGLNLYDNTNLQQQDQQTVQDYSQGAMNRAMALLGNYDAKAAGAGSGLYKDDTAKDRSRSQIAADSALKVSDLQANLDSTRAQRQAALLPSAAQAAAGSSDAMYLDQQQQTNNAAQSQGILSAAQLIGGLFGHQAASVPQNGRSVYFGTNTSNLGYVPSYTPNVGSTMTSGYTGLKSF